MHPRRTTLAALAVAAATVLAACGGSDAGVDVSGSRDDESTGTESTGAEPTGTEPPGDTSAPGDTSDPSGGDPFGWEPCLGGELECGTLDVPLDYDDESAGTITLALVKHPAQNPDDRIGSLLVNPGGPGYGGSFLAEQADFIYSEALLDSFDIIGFDPRGTGDSTPAVDCVDDYDPFFAPDPTPETGEEKDELVATGEEFGAACLERSGDLLQHISTEDAARDMDSIRVALGEDTISYFGFSYGSELGSVWATLFPDTVRAAVLDGAADPNADYVEGGLQQAVGFEGQLDTFLARCSADSDCQFHNDGDAEGAFDELFASLDSDPLVVSADRVSVNQGVGLTGVANAMYTELLWPQLERALADAQDGDGSGLLQLYDDYLQRESDGTYGDEYEAFLAITCLDDPGPRTVEGVDAEAERFIEAAPRLGAWFASGYICALWPVEPHGEVPVTGAGAGPIVVIGTTGDAATPLESSRAMADTLEDGRLIVVTADQHTGYGVNSCVNDAVDAYLVELEAPVDELACE